MQVVLRATLSAAALLLASVAQAATPSDPAPETSPPVRAAPPVDTAPSRPIVKPSEPDCRAEVAEAIEKQKKAGKFRMESNIITEQGPVKMTTEYVVPDRMRQVVTIVIDPKPVETIVIGKEAWSNNGQGWKPLDEETTRELVMRMDEAIGEMTPDVGSFLCRGTRSIDGREVKAFEAEEPGPKDLSPDAATKKPRNEAARYIYVDTQTGLPERSIFAKRDNLDKPIFKSVYTYPADIKIEKPSDVK